jgi:hypothetical protein
MMLIYLEKPAKRLSQFSAHKEDDAEAAIVEFQDVVNTEEEQGDWYVIVSAREILFTVFQMATVANCLLSLGVSRP